MLWNVEAQITRQMYLASKEVIWYMRLLGLCPLVMCRDAAGWVLRFSPGFLIYSCVFGVVLFSGFAYSVYEESLRGKENSIKIKSDMDLAITSMAHTAYLTVCFYGIFVMPSKAAQFFKYVERINEVDLAIGNVYSKKDKYVALVLLIGLLIVTVVFSCLDFGILYDITHMENKALVIIARYHAIDLALLVALTIEYSNRHLAHGLQLRLHRLNLILNAHYEELLSVRKPVERNYITSKEFKLETKVQSIVELRGIYMKLLDGAKILDSLLGINAVANLISVMLLLTTSSYYLIIAVQGNRYTVVLPPKVLLFCLHIIRILLLTEPWYACYDRMQVTKTLVCKLLSLNTPLQYRKQVHCFAWIICLREFRFVACGFFEVDRAVFTSMLGAVTTYLVVLLQNDLDKKH